MGWRRDEAMSTRTLSRPSSRTTLSIPVYGGEFLDTVAECCQSAKLRVSRQVIPFVATDGEHHVLVLVAHSDV
jgi:hypothetical protein